MIRVWMITLTIMTTIVVLWLSQPANAFIESKGPDDVPKKELVRAEMPNPYGRVVCYIYDKTRSSNMQCIEYESNEEALEAFKGAFK